MSTIGEKFFTHNRIKHHTEILCMFLIFFMVIENTNTTFSQSQTDPQSAINSICAMVQDNSLIAGLVGLDQAVNICNNVHSIGSNQALSELCNIVSGLKIINVDSYCNTSTQDLDQKSQNQTGTATPNTSANSNNNNQDPNISGSIIDRLIGFLLDQFGL
ncbi:hypothetical protein [Candidatus Nitrosocosmicus hydrocola]|uniref:hypothetical protein n=1 Tax=Candidatus Nitrosocosmicus hydrocola TaxID=1826872 RepID=UPI0011E597E4|nr:hypothetical protein [Candidatus Nitrosocosmicus hydrocola]